jgi:hypothetical protein
MTKSQIRKNTNFQKDFKKIGHTMDNIQKQVLHVVSDVADDISMTFSIILLFSESVFTL